MADEKVVDETTQVVDDKTADKTDKADAKPDDKDTSVEDKKPADDSKIDPKKYEAAVAAEKTLNSILDKHGYGSIDELEQDVKEGRTIKELIGDADAKELVKKARTLDEYQAHWNKEKEKKLREEEEPEETIERLEKELKEERQRKKQEHDQKQKRENAIKLIENFNNIVTTEIKKDSEITEAARPFAEKFLGVNNPANEVNLNKPVDIRKMARENLKLFKEFQQAIIKDYLDGKSDMTDIEETDNSGPADAGTKIMNMNDARTSLFARLGIKK